MNKGRSLSWQAALVLPLAAGFFGTAISIVISDSVHAVMNDGASALQKIATTTAASVPTTVSVQTDDTTAAGNPVRLIIPSIGIDAAVQSVGIAETGTGDIGTPNNATDVAWYNRGPVPGSPGIAIIDGHLDTHTVPEAVFYHLGDLTEGESIYVTDRAGVQQRFVVTGRQQLAYDADTSMLFVHSNTPQIALITCAGDWVPDKHEYTDRVVVFATLANESVHI
ncbi:MAG: peptidase sortase [Parcubacteria group bacterium]|nr:peptidase sortase [Parcubacteria group bacterium]